MIHQFNCPACGTVAGSGEYRTRAQNQACYNWFDLSGELADPTQPPFALLGFANMAPSIQEASFLCLCGVKVATELESNTVPEKLELTELVSFHSPVCPMCCTPINLEAATIHATFSGGGSTKHYKSIQFFCECGAITKMETT